MHQGRDRHDSLRRQGNGASEAQSPAFIRLTPIGRATDLILQTAVCELSVRARRSLIAHWKVRIFFNNFDPQYACLAML
jgi:hypothetical protein